MSVGIDRHSTTDDTEAPIVLLMSIFLCFANDSSASAIFFSFLSDHACHIHLTAWKIKNLPFQIISPRFFPDIVLGSGCA